MEGGGFYHDQHTAMLSTDHIRNIGSKAEYASIAKGNAKAWYTGSVLKCWVWRLRIGQAKFTYKIKYYERSIKIMEMIFNHQTTFGGLLWYLLKQR